MQNNNREDSCIYKDGFGEVIRVHDCVNHKRKRVSEKPETLVVVGRGSKIRTYDPLLPKQVR